MVKRLIDKIKGRVKKAVLLGTAIATFGAFVNCTNPTPSNSPPRINSNPIEQVDEKNNYYYDADAFDLDGDQLFYYLESAPSWLSINPNTGVISGIAPEVSSDTDYPISVKVEDGEDFDIQNYTLTVKDTTQPDYVDISGKLEDCETDTGKQGLIKIYNATNNSYLDECAVDSSGNFSITLDELVSELPDGVKLQAQLTEGSYIRTMKLPQGDNEDVNARCVPYDSTLSYDDGLISTQSDIDNFKEHMDRVNFSDAVVINPAAEPGSHYLKKWNYGDFPEITEQFYGIEVSENDFDDTKFEEIKTAIKNSGHLKANEINIIHGDDHIGETGWGRIVYGTSPQCKIWDTNQNGYIDKFETTINTTNADVVNHEVTGHGLTYPGHASELGIPKLFDSIMVWTGPTSPFKPADKKGNYIVDEETYKGMENIDDILGTDWF